ncbi:MAG: Rieske (2Fe-2S) protein [Acidimicrobiales bacterium]|jgi:nitrite reductase/ring-hydroxylating ferredoxin subunit|nr:Rieske (2Fe-2S) protein [Acidimicrobiales bacterium]
MTDVLPPRDTSGPAALPADSPAEESRYPFGIPYGWFCVAWSHELAVGEVVPRFYFGRHLVLWRDDEGQAHLQDAFCPHLGAHLAYGGQVRGCALQCPFHGWEFDGDGVNTRIPYSERTNAKAKIRSYPVQEVAGALVYAWYHPHDEPPLFELDIPEEFTSEDFSDWTFRHFSVPAACQELAENSVDGPHFRYVHNTEIVPEIVSYETEGTTASMRSIQKFPTPRGVVDGKINVDNQGPGFGVTRFSGIVDTCLLGSAVPVDANHCEVRFSFKTRSLGDAQSTSSVSEAFVQEVCNQFRDDWPIWINKAHLTRPALADTDPPFMKFRKWYSQFYADGVAPADGVVYAPAPPPAGQQPAKWEREHLTASFKHRTSED